MSLTAAEAHLRSPRFIGRSSFDKYTVTVLRSLCTKLQLVVASSGKLGKPIKKDYIDALHDFRGKFIPIAAPGRQEIVTVANASKPPGLASPVASMPPSQSDDITMDSPVASMPPSQSDDITMDPPVASMPPSQSDDITMDPPQQSSDIPNDIFAMQGNPLFVEEPRPSALNGNRKISRNNAPTSKKDKRLLTRKVAIRLYAGARDWNHVRQVECNCRPNGDIDLVQLARLLNVNGCSIIDPKNNRLFHQYSPGVLEADDIDSLMEKGFLRVVCTADR